MLGRLSRSSAQCENRLAMAGPQLVLAGHVVLVAEVLTLKKDTLALDKTALVRFVDRAVSNLKCDAGNEIRSQL